MATPSFENTLRDIRNKVLQPVYFLTGEEPFYIDIIAKTIEEKILTDEEKEFNLNIVYGKDTDIPTIVSMAKRFPMMASHNIVIVREAQHIQNFDDLVPYLRQPLASTILVICYKYKKLDRRTILYKEADKTGLVFAGRKLYDNEVPGWISKYIQRHGYTVGNKEVQMLADHLGNDLGKIVNEVKKLFINMEKGAKVTANLIEEYIGISKEYNIFELQGALGTRNSSKAYQIVRYFSDNPKSVPMVFLTGVLYQFFAKTLLYQSLADKSAAGASGKLGVNPFFVTNYATAAKNYSTENLINIISMLRIYDLKSKGLENESASQGELIRDLVTKILN